MEILSNFSSVYCFISFVIGAVFMLTVLCIAAMGKVQEPRNKVRFYVTKNDGSGIYNFKPILWMDIPKRGLNRWYPTKTSMPIAFDEEYFKCYGLNINDYEYIKWEDEPVEVFINMED